MSRTDLYFTRWLLLVCLRRMRDASGDFKSSGSIHDSSTKPHWSLTSSSWPFALTARIQREDASTDSRLSAGCLQVEESRWSEHFHGDLHQRRTSLLSSVHFPWYPDGQFRKYPRRWTDRPHCRQVWEKGAEEHNYDVDPSSSEELSEESSDQSS
jgi:hypothetical protein